MSVRRSAALFVTLALLVLEARPASSAGPGADGAPVAVRVELDAPPGCSSADAFFAAVAARTRRARRASAGEESGVRLLVRLARTGAGVHGQLRVAAGAAAASDTREVDGATCDEVAQVLSLTAALAIDPTARLTPAPSSSSPAPASTPAPAPSSSTPSPPPTSSAGSPSPAETSTPARPSSPAAPSPPASPSRALAPASARPAEPAPAAPVADATSSTPAASASTSAPPRPRAVAALLGVRAAAADVVSPTLGVGGGLFARLRAAGESAGPRPSVGLGLLYVPNDLLGQAGDVVAHFTALDLSLCPGLGWRRGALAVEACALGMGGWLTARERGVTNPRSASRSWWSAGALARAALPVGAGLIVELEGGATFPLVKRRFITTTPEETVAETPLVSLLLGLGVAREF